MSTDVADDSPGRARSVGPWPVNGVRRALAAYRDAPSVDVAIGCAALLGLLAGPALNRSGPELSAAVVALAVVTSAPLVARRRFPIATLAVVSAGLLACLAVFRPNVAAVGVEMLAVFTVGVEGRRSRSVLVGAAMAPLVTAAVAIASHRFGFGETAIRLSVVLGALLAGDAVRGRRLMQRLLIEEAAREREAEARHRFDQDRLRLAHELHDTVAHALVAINVQAAAGAHRLRGQPGEELTRLQEITRGSADALAELRSTLKLLRPASEPAPLRPVQSFADLDDLVDGVRRAGVEVDLRVGPIVDELATPVAHAGYRIVQEGLTNILRHSHSRRASVHADVAGGALEIEILDPGPARARQAPPAGNGLRGMVERADALGGSCESGATHDGGWRVHARLPTGQPQP